MLKGKLPQLRPQSRSNGFCIKEDSSLSCSCLSFKVELSQGGRRLFGHCGSQRSSVGSIKFKSLNKGAQSVPCTKVYVIATSQSLAASNVVEDYCLTDVVRTPTSLRIVDGFSR
jgi:hypothetical protein